jgi:RNA polymerase sigma-70 factor (ECF subfamily)
MNSNETSRSGTPAQPGPEELAESFALHREQLRRMVYLRLDRRLQSRVDPSDVLQEAFLEASARYGDYCEKPVMPLFVWLRFLVGQRLLIMHRQHLGVKARDAGRDVSLYQGALPTATSESLAAQLLGDLTSPSEAATRAELQVRLQVALNGMDAIDREVLALRHFEQLSNKETAQVLGIQERTASNRYIRALRRLREILVAMPGFFE